MSSELNINNKIHLLNTKTINDVFIKGDDKNIMIFEYLAKFDDSYLFDIISNLNLDVQIKIKKELYKESIDDLLKNDFFDLKTLNEESSEKFKIIFNKNQSIDSIQVNEENIQSFISEEKGEQFIYRHYIIINIPEDEKVDSFIYNFISQIQNENLIIRSLKEKELYNYFFKEVNFPLKNKTYKKKIQTQNKKESMKISDIFKPSKFSGNIVNTLDKYMNIFENIFFQQNIEGIDQYMIDILSNTTIKHENSLQIGDNFKGGLILQAIPKDDFNILKFIFHYLENGDSITINMYPESKHIIHNDTEVTGMDKLLQSSEEVTREDNITYLQLLVNLNDINEIILSDRINKLKLNIGADFLASRLIGNMSRYFTTHIGVGNNSLHLERGFQKERLRNNLIF